MVNVKFKVDRHAFDHIRLTVLDAFNKSDDIPSTVELEFNFTHEGLIVDAVLDGEVIKTTSITYIELMEMMK